MRQEELKVSMKKTANRYSRKAVSKSCRNDPERFLLRNKKKT